MNQEDYIDLRILLGILAALFIAGVIHGLIV